MMLSNPIGDSSTKGVGNILQAGRSIEAISGVPLRGFRPHLIEPLKHPTSQNAQQSEILVPHVRNTTRH